MFLNNSDVMNLKQEHSSVPNFISIAKKRSTDFDVVDGAQVNRHCSDSPSSLSSGSKCCKIRRPKHRLQRHHYWILLLRHASKCRKSPTECKLPRCFEMKKICYHIKHCTKGMACTVKHCITSKMLLSHYMRCSQASKGSSSTAGNESSRWKSCSICAPVKFAIRQGKSQLSLENLVQDFEGLSVAVDMKEPVFTPALQGILCQKTNSIINK